ncbi:hypothetical protein GCM10011521_28200 [Arenimonas soli]|uniref:Lipoprotein n=1 Tax=Arenimonas soli TaxID=2269504 RepID=A0ABQ1HU71_9GAMM|nr:hypothetical protein GCM10011521_28200 [Arenimonas soli]
MLGAKMKIPALLAIGLLATPTLAQACSDPVVRTFTESLDSAEHVFVFRLSSLELTNDEAWPSSLRGRITLVRSLKGGEPAARNIEFVAGACCSIKLTVGRYYLAVSKVNSQTLSLVPGDQSVIDVTDGFTAGARSSPEALGPVVRFLSGEALPKDYPGEHRLSSTLSCPLPAVGT